MATGSLIMTASSLIKVPEQCLGRSLAGLWLVSSQSLARSLAGLWLEKGKGAIPCLLMILKMVLVRS